MIKIFAELIELLYASYKSISEYLSFNHLPNNALQENLPFIKFETSFFI